MKNILPRPRSLAGLAAALMMTLASCGQAASNPAGSASLAGLGPSTAASAAAPSSPAIAKPGASAGASAKPAASSATAAKPAGSGGASAKPAAPSGASSKPAASAAGAGSGVPKTNGLFAGGDPNGEKVRISYASPAVSDIPYYASVNNGFFQQQHLNVTMLQMAVNVAIPALSKGETEFTDSPSNAMEGATRGLPFKVLFSAWQKSPWTLYGKAQYKTVQDLKGKTIGTNQAGSTPFVYMTEGLKQNGMSNSDFKIVSSSGTQVTYTTLLSGQLDAAVLSPPFDAQAQAAGFHEILFLGDYLALPYVGLATSSDYLSAHRPTVVATIRSLLDANKYLKTHISEAGMLIQKYTGAPADVAQISAEKMMPLLSDSGEFRPEGIQQAIDIQAQVTNTKIDLKPDQIVDYGPLHEALAKGS
jgi:ABC-type nitrate/sulfonate/bicarbonate transport system substrate-binding protein